MFGIDDAILIGLAGAGTALNIFGQSKQAAAAKQQALQQADDAEYAADLADDNVRLTLEQTDKEAHYLEFENKLAIGNIRASFGASGVILDGTPREFLEQQSAIGVENVMNLRHKGILEARGYRIEGQSQRRRAVNLRNAAENADEAGIIAAIGAGVSGATEIAKASGAGYSRRTMNDGTSSVPKLSRG